MNTRDLIEAAKTANGCSEADIAKRIGIAPQTLNTFKKGKAIPDRIAQRLADLAGLERAATLAGIAAEKADEETRETWAEIARRAATGAAMLAMVGCALPYRDVYADAGFTRFCTLPVYYVKSAGRRLLTLFLGLLRHKRQRGLAF